ncbi:nuclear apoptosis-inducing factor 1-like isoform X2 [Haliotis cracherodii]|uniref:nuclear apoptosis-inducing factor 1-like isoform X2 n=1 Tax=Haliotis cracherodii TaxID=6455 RepID=UPI0039E8963D
MDASTSSKKRKRNFGPGEIEVLLAGVEANTDTLNSSFTNSVTNASKKKIWSDITQKINASGTAARNEEEIRKKWTDLKAAVKKAESGRRENQRKTGGGPPPDELSSLEKRILQLIPRCAVEGIPGGIESPVPDFREESNCTFGSGTQAEEIEVDMCLGMAVDAFENDSQTALTPKLRGTELSSRTSFIKQPSHPIPYSYLWKYQEEIITISSR